MISSPRLVWYNSRSGTRRAAIVHDVADDGAATLTAFCQPYADNTPHAVEFLNGVPEGTGPHTWQDGGEEAQPGRPGGAWGAEWDRLKAEGQTPPQEPQEGAPESQHQAGQP
jgi:hypothetical protein